MNRSGFFPAGFNTRYLKFHMYLFISLLNEAFVLLLLFLLGLSDAYTRKIPNRYVTGLILWWAINQLPFPSVGVWSTSDAISAVGTWSSSDVISVMGAFSFVRTFFVAGMLRILSASAIAALVLFASVLFRLLTKRKGIGAGDVKLIFALTLYIGFDQGLMQVFISCILAVISLFAAKVIDYKAYARQGYIQGFLPRLAGRPFPFGPPIVCATVLIRLMRAVAEAL